MGLTKQAKTLCKGQVALLFMMLKGTRYRIKRVRQNDTLSSYRLSPIQSELMLVELGLSKGHAFSMAALEFIDAGVIFSLIARDLLSVRYSDGSTP